MNVFHVRMKRRVTEYRVVTVHATSEREARKWARALAEGSAEPDPDESVGEWCDSSAEGKPIIFEVVMERGPSARAAIAKAKGKP